MVLQADLMIALGVRFDDRVTGKLEAFATHARIVHIDIDPAEIHKNKEAHIPICAGEDSSKFMVRAQPIVCFVCTVSLHMQNSGYLTYCSCQRFAPDTIRLPKCHTFEH
eukprot:GHRR01029868.1.p1 GENE.GHRR01029868.1~~GHRR01029868.1.p1  ORF type:complete len:109 (-),score=20.69 GHRR01029868.1:346-672(-)